MLGKPDIQTVFMCHCGSECAMVSYDVPTDYDRCEMIFLSGWSMGLSADNRYLWRQRIHLAWRILRTGRMYFDNLTFDPPTARALGTKLVEAANEVEEASRKLPPFTGVGYSLEDQIESGGKQ